MTSNSKIFPLFIFVSLFLYTHSQYSVIKAKALDSYCEKSIYNVIIDIEINNPLQEYKSFNFVAYSTQNLLFKCIIDPNQLKIKCLSNLQQQRISLLEDETITLPYPFPEVEGVIWDYNSFLLTIFRRTIYLTQECSDSEVRLSVSKLNLTQWDLITKVNKIYDGECLLSDTKDNFYSFKMNFDIIGGNLNDLLNETSGSKDTTEINFMQNITMPFLIGPIQTLVQTDVKYQSHEYYKTAFCYPMETITSANYQKEEGIDFHCNIPISDQYIFNGPLRVSTFFDRVYANVSIGNEEDDDIDYISVYFTTEKKPVLNPNNDDFFGEDEEMVDDFDEENFEEEALVENNEEENNGNEDGDKEEEKSIDKEEEKSNDKEEEKSNDKEEEKNNDKEEEKEKSNNKEEEDVDKEEENDDEKVNDKINKEKQENNVISNNPSSSTSSKSSSSSVQPSSSSTQSLSSSVQSSLTSVQSSSKSVQSPSPSIQSSSSKSQTSSQFLSSSVQSSSSSNQPISSSVQSSSTQTSASSIQSSSSSVQSTPSSAQSLSSSTKSSSSSAKTSNLRALQTKETKKKKDYLLLDNKKSNFICPDKPIFEIVNIEKGITYEPFTDSEDKYNVILTGYLKNGYKVSDKKIVPLEYTLNEIKFNLSITNNLVEETTEKKKNISCYLGSGTMFLESETAKIKCTGNKLEQKNLGNTDITVNWASRENKYLNDIVIKWPKDLTIHSKKLYSYNINILSIKKSDYDCYDDKFYFYVNILNLSTEPQISFELEMNNPSDMKANCRLYSSNLLKCFLDLRLKKIKKDTNIRLPLPGNYNISTIEGNFINLTVLYFNDGNETEFSDEGIWTDETCGNNMFVGAIQDIGYGYGSAIAIIISILAIFFIALLGIGYCVLYEITHRKKKGYYPHTEEKKQQDQSEVNASVNPMNLPNIVAK